MKYREYNEEDDTYYCNSCETHNPSSYMDFSCLYCRVCVNNNTNEPESDKCGIQCIMGDGCDNGCL
jgi:late competence protein required for DNA uptake (superfamily II DNA/RNA helicase)